MQFIKAKTLGNVLLKKHGLDKKGYRLFIIDLKKYNDRVFFERRSNAGATIRKENVKIIFLDSLTTYQASREVVKTIILHEIAHYFTDPLKYPGHNVKFKIECKKLGISSETSLNMSWDCSMQINQFENHPYYTKIKYNESKMHRFFRFILSKLNNHSLMINYELEERNELS